MKRPCFQHQVEGYQPECPDCRLKPCYKHRFQGYQEDCPECIKLNHGEEELMAWQNGEAQFNIKGGKVAKIKERVLVPGLIQAVAIIGRENIDRVKEHIGDSACTMREGQQFLATKGLFLGCGVVPLQWGKDGFKGMVPVDSSDGGMALVITKDGQARVWDGREILEPIEDAFTTMRGLDEVDLAEWWPVRWLV